MKKNRILLLIAFIVIGKVAFGQSYDYCIHNVSVIKPERPTPLISNQDVFIRGNTIVLVSKASTGNPKNCKQVIDGSGKFLMPGLSDMHVHLPSENIEKFLLLNLDAGVTTIRSMRGKMSHIQLKKDIARGVLLGPDLYIATPYFPNKNIKISDLRDSIRGFKAAGFDFVKVLAVPDSAYFETLMKEANEIHFPVVGHAPWQIPVDRLIESGYSCIEHLQDLDEIHEKNPALIPPLVQKMKLHHTYNCPTLDYYNVMWEQVPVEELIRRKGLEFIDQPKIDEWQQTVSGYFEKTNHGSGDSVTRKKEKLKNYMQNKFHLLKTLNDLGSPMILSPAEANDPFGVPGFCVWEEMKLYAAAGISNKDILKMATYNAAEFFHEAKRWGSIASGRRANLVLLEKNPLESIDNIDSQDGVFIEGKYFLKSELEHRIKN